MTYISDTITLIETLLGRTVPPAQLIRIADAFIHSDPYHLSGWYTEVFEPDPPIEEDPKDYPHFVQREPTNDEKAELVFKSFLQWGRDIVRAKAEFDKAETERLNSLANIKAAGDAAEIDFT